MLVHSLAHSFIHSFSHPATPGTVSTVRSGSLPVSKKKTEGEKQVVMLTPGRTEGRKLAETQFCSLQVLKPLARIPLTMVLSFLADSGRPAPWFLGLG